MNTKLNGCTYMMYLLKSRLIAHCTYTCTHTHTPRDTHTHTHTHTHNQCHLLFLQWMRKHSRLPRSESALVEVFLGTLSQDGDTCEALSKELVDSCWASLYSEYFVFESTPPAAGRER